MKRVRFMYFVLGVFVGGAAGVAIGLLFAPSAGVQTRGRLANEASRVAEAARHVAEQVESMAQALGVQKDHYLGRDEEMAWRKVQEIREGVQKYSRTVMSS